MKNLQRKLLLLLILSFACLCSPSAYAQEGPETEPGGEEECSNENPHACFDGFGEDGEVKPKSDKVKRTFSFPAVKAGFVIDVYDVDILPHLALEVKDFTILKNDFTIDIGVSTSRAFVSLTWELIPIIKIGPSIWGGYNVKEKQPAFGIGFSMLDF